MKKKVHVNCNKAREYEVRECILHPWETVPDLIIWNVFSEQVVIFRNGCYWFVHDTWCVRCGSISAYVWVNGICQFCRWIGKFSTESRDYSRGRVDSPSWQLTLHCHSSDDWSTCELLAGELRICSSLKWIVLVLENQESNACNKSPVYQHPVWGQQQ